jgi:hypothetical protein
VLKSEHFGAYDLEYEHSGPTVILEAWLQEIPEIQADQAFLA